MVFYPDKKANNKGKSVKTAHREQKSLERSFIKNLWSITLYNIQVMLQRVGVAVICRGGCNGSHKAKLSIQTCASDENMLNQ